MNIRKIIVDFTSAVNHNNIILHLFISTPDHPFPKEKRKLSCMHASVRMRQKSSRLIEYTTIAIVTNHLKCFVKYFPGRQAMRKINFSLNLKNSHSNMFWYAYLQDITFYSDYFINSFLKKI